MDMIASGIQLPPIDTPFVNDQAYEISKDGLHKQDLGKELKPDKHLVSVVDVIKNVQTDGKGHLRDKLVLAEQSFKANLQPVETYVNDTNDNGLLHLI